MSDLQPKQETELKHLMKENKLNGNMRINLQITSNQSRNMEEVSDTSTAEETEKATEARCLSST